MYEFHGWINIVVSEPDEGSWEEDRARQRPGDGRSVLGTGYMLEAELYDTPRKR
jgi:hypothetical protein